MSTIKLGYIYVLVHPSDPELYKIGVTTLKPEQRLAQHNSNYSELTGRIVKKTGQKWELKEYHTVIDRYWAETAFWGATPFADIPDQHGVEVKKMKWEWVQAGLNAAKKSNLRPPELLPDWVYAYTRWMNKLLEGRGITLVGYVKSKSGKSKFQCSNGHEWTAHFDDVAEGKGCPHCGIGEREPEKIWQVAKRGYICLLTHPDKPGVIKIGLTYNRLEQWHEKCDWNNWTVHRYRLVEEPVLAEKIIWELLGQPLPHDREPIKIDLNVAEQAFRDLIPQMHHEIAIGEKIKEDVQKN